MEQENLNKNKSVWAKIFWPLLTGVLITLLITLKACPGSPNEIKTGLNQALEPIKTQLTTLAAQEKKRLEEQKVLENFRQEVLKKLPAILKSVSELEKNLAARPAPENPNDFQTLPECREKYETLKESYTICLDLDTSRKEQLKLFSQVYENLTTQKTLLEGAVKDLQDQVKGYASIEKKVTDSMDKLDRSYKLNRTWRDVKYVAPGIGVGVAASAVTIAAITLIKALKK